MKLLLSAALVAAMVGPGLAPTAQAGVLSGAARSAIAKRAMTPPPRLTPPAAASKPRDVVLHRSRHPGAAAHVDLAQRKGQPTILNIDRTGTSRNRAESMRGVGLNPKPAKNLDRDEYPPAFTRQGGHNASVRFINRHDNRGAGSSMRAQTRDLPDGSRIRVLVAD